MVSGLYNKSVSKGPYRFHKSETQQQGVTSGIFMAEKVNMPLPDIICEDFESSWIYFELAVAAKEWSSKKQLSTSFTDTVEGQATQS